MAETFRQRTPTHILHREEVHRFQEKSGAQGRGATFKEFQEDNRRLGVAFSPYFRRKIPNLLALPGPRLLIWENRLDAVP
jgi:hypothetical protein